MDAKKCNRCDALYERKYASSLAIVEIHGARVGKDGAQVVVDFCDSCSDDWFTFMRAKKLEALKAPAEPTKA